MLQLSELAVTVPDSASTEATVDLRFLFFLAGLVCFFVPTILLATPERRNGNLVSMLSAGCFAIAGELLRGIMTLTNMRGYRVAFPVFCVATVTTLAAVLIGLPGSGA